MIAKVSPVRKQVKPAVLHRREIRKIARACELFMKAQPDYKEKGKQLKVSKNRKMRRNAVKRFIMATSYGMNQSCTNQKKMSEEAFKALLLTYTSRMNELHAVSEESTPKKRIDKYERWKEVLNKK